MLKRKTRVAGAAVLCLAAIACQKSSPSPTSPTGSSSATAASTTDARTGVTVIAAKPAAPASAVSIAWAQQPITLTVTNGITTGTSPLTYTFEVGTEPSLGTATITKGPIAAGN